MADFDAALLKRMTDNHDAIVRLATMLVQRYGMEVLFTEHPKWFTNRHGNYYWTVIVPTPRTRELPPAAVHMEWSARIAQALRIRRELEGLLDNADIWLDLLAFPGMLRARP